MPNKSASPEALELLVGHGDSPALVCTQRDAYVVDRGLPMRNSLNVRKR
jgi:hypothetical protein